MSQTKRLSQAQRRIVTAMGTGTHTSAEIAFYNRSAMEHLQKRGLVKTDFGGRNGERVWWLTHEGVAVHRELTELKQP